jgi:hypothetical protein
MWWLAGPVPLRRNWPVTAMYCHVLLQICLHFFYTCTCKQWLIWLYTTGLSFWGEWSLHHHHSPKLDRELFITHLCSGYSQLHIYHTQGVIFSKITHLFSLKDWSRLLLTRYFHTKSADTSVHQERLPDDVPLPVYLQSRLCNFVEYLIAFCHLRRHLLADNIYCW